jgi:hypothetical protein
MGTPQRRDGADCPSWALLGEAAAESGSRSIAELQQGDSGNLSDRLVSGAGLTLDLTRQRVNAEVLRLFAQLADELSCASGSRRCTAMSP